MPMSKFDWNLEMRDARCETRDVRRETLSKLGPRTLIQTGTTESFHFVTVLVGIARHSTQIPHAMAPNRPVLFYVVLEPFLHTPFLAYLFLFLIHSFLAPMIFLKIQILVGGYWKLRGLKSCGRAGFCDD